MGKTLLMMAALMLFGCGDDDRMPPDSGGTDSGGSDSGTADTGVCTGICLMDSGMDTGGGVPREVYEPCDPGDDCRNPAEDFSCGDFMGRMMCTKDCTEDDDCLTSEGTGRCVPVGAAGQCARPCNVGGDPGECRIGFECGSTPRGDACLPI